MGDYQAPRFLPLGTLPSEGSRAAWLAAELGQKPRAVVLRPLPETASRPGCHPRWRGEDAPHLLRVLDVAELEDGRYAVEEHVDGVTFAELRDCARARGKLVPPLVVARLVADACEGLRALEAAGDDPGLVAGASGVAAAEPRRDPAAALLVGFDGRARVVPAALGMPAVSAADAGRVLAAWLRDELDGPDDAGLVPEPLRLAARRGAEREGRFDLAEFRSALLRCLAGGALAGPGYVKNLLVDLVPMDAPPRLAARKLGAALATLATPTTEPAPSASHTSTSPRDAPARAAGPSSHTPIRSPDTSARTASGPSNPSIPSPDASGRAESASGPSDPSIPSPDASGRAESASDRSHPSIPSPDASARAEGLAPGPADTPEPPRDGSADAVGSVPTPSHTAASPRDTSGRAEGFAPDPAATREPPRAVAAGAASSAAAATTDARAGGDPARVEAVRWPVSVAAAGEDASLEPRTGPRTGVEGSPPPPSGSAEEDARPRSAGATRAPAGAAAAAGRAPTGGLQAPAPARDAALAPRTGVALVTRTNAGSGGAVVAVPAGGHARTRRGPWPLVAAALGGALLALAAVHVGGSQSDASVPAPPAATSGPAADSGDAAASSPAAGQATAAPRAPPRPTEDVPVAPATRSERRSDARQRADTRRRAATVRSPPTGAVAQALVGPTATVEIHAPAGSAVEIDGERRGLAPFKAPLPVAEGSHLIRVTLGRGVYDARLAARAGEEYTLDVTFVGDL